MSPIRQLEMRAIPVHLSKTVKPYKRYKMSNITLLNWKYPSSLLLPHPKISNIILPEGTQCSDFEEIELVWVIFLGVYETPYVKLQVMKATHVKFLQKWEKIIKKK